MKVGDLVKPKNATELQSWVGVIVDSRDVSAFHDGTDYRDFLIHWPDWGSQAWWVDFSLEVVSEAC